MKLILKTLLFVVFALLSYQNLFSQSLSLGELIKLNNFNEDEFDTFITTKGFKYDGFEDKERAILKSYTFYEDGVKTSYVTKITYKSENTEMISFQTPHTELYLNAKVSLKSLGFIYTSTERNGNTTFMYYTKGNLSLALVSTTDENRTSGPKTIYEISITK